VDDADRRSRRLALTADGRALLAEATPIWKRHHAALERQLKRSADALRADLVTLSQA
jgi:DNA-binding MarR family transcriptional regulator